MTDQKNFSLDDLDATKAAASGFEFEFVGSDGNGTGIFFTVLGSQSEVVTREVNRLINERRRADAARAVARSIGNGKKAVEFEPLESDIEFGERLAAVRLVSWRGISEPCTPDNALRLCRINKEAAKQITAASEEMGNFTLI